MRSKVFLASNILASIYCTVLSWSLVGLAILDSGRESIINTLGGFFETAFELVGMNLAIINYLFVLSILLLVHIGLVIVGCIVSWIAYAIKKDSVATVAAVIYLIGAICSPLCLIFGITISVLAFVGASNQRKLNKK